MIKSCCLLLLITIWSVTGTQAQKKTDLADIKFNENAGTILKGVSLQKRDRPNEAIYYTINNKRKFSYAGIALPYEVEIGTQRNIICSYYITLGKTVITKQVLQALLTKYHQPTKKIRDNENAKAYYWQTPTLFIQFMADWNGRPDKGYFTGFAHIATLKSLNAGFDPDFKHVYDLFKEF